MTGNKRPSRADAIGQDPKRRRQQEVHQRSSDIEKRNKAAIEPDRLLERQIEERIADSG
jgi:hypothetical protein